MMVSGIFEEWTRLWVGVADFLSDGLVWIARFIDWYGLVITTHQRWWQWFFLMSWYGVGYLLYSYRKRNECSRSRQ
jgi:hypothetical protein